jgi:hypothetical protein
MSLEVAGCKRCGSVVRADSFEGPWECWECGAPMSPISLVQAKESVAARRRASERRRSREARSQVGLPDRV